ncbi:MAG: large-conductance mechanosensitive channel protein MscL [Algisphaera sp.]
MIAEFKEFAMKGSVVDLAVGVVIGAAFGKIISSVVEKVFMPLAGWAMAGVDLSKLSFVLPAAVEGQEPAEIGYGVAIQAGIEFLIVAMALFIVIKLVNSAKKKEEAAPAAPAADIVLLTEIRDSLKSR